MIHEAGRYEIRFNGSPTMRFTDPRFPVSLRRDVHAEAGFCFLFET